MFFHFEHGGRSGGNSEHGKRAHICSNGIAAVGVMFNGFVVTADYNSSGVVGGSGIYIDVGKAHTLHRLRIQTQRKGSRPSLLWEMF